MKSFIQLLAEIIIFFVATGITNGQPEIEKKRSPVDECYLSLNGEVLSKGNLLEAAGNIHKFNFSRIASDPHEHNIFQRHYFITDG